MKCVMVRCRWHAARVLDRVIEDSAERSARSGRAAPLRVMVRDTERVEDHVEASKRS